MGTSKPEYGKVPQYLQSVKAEIQQEYAYVAGMGGAGGAAGGAWDGGEVERGYDISLLEAAEVEDLKQGLQERWDQLNKRYQRIIHCDTIQQVKRKEALEAEMDQIESDIAKLDAQFVFLQD